MKKYSFFIRKGIIFWPINFILFTFAMGLFLEGIDPTDGGEISYFCLGVYALVVAVMAIMFRRRHLFKKQNKQLGG